MSKMRVKGQKKLQGTPNAPPPACLGLNMTIPRLNDLNTDIVWLI